MTRHSSPADAERDSAATPAIFAEAVVKRFDEILALDGVSLAVQEGECVALVGESGSGKTTLLRSLNALVRPDAGRVMIGGRDLRDVDAVELRRRIGYVPQDGGLLPHWKVGRNAELVPRLLGDDGGARRKADESLRLVGLDPIAFRERWPSELSGGQRQRVALARALAAGPMLLLLDEPFGALDAITRADLQEAFAELRAKHATGPMTCVLVTHDLHEAFLLADRVAVLRRGRMEQVGSPSELVEAPASSYVRDLLSRARVTSADTDVEFVRQPRES